MCRKTRTTLKTSDGAVLVNNHQTGIKIVEANEKFEDEALLNNIFKYYIAHASMITQEGTTEKSKKLIEE